MICPICQTDNPVSIHKPLVEDIINYSTCSNCGCCYTLDEINTFVNNKPELRNADEQNKLRLERILKYSVKNPYIIDFGAGQGEFADYCNHNNNTCHIIDKGTARQLSWFEAGDIDVINLVEVIEHIPNPQGLVQEFERVLKPEGIIYLETGFTDIFGADSWYTDPNLGHCLVHSYKSLEILFKNFELTKINDFVIILKKRS